MAVFRHCPILERATKKNFMKLPTELRLIISFYLTELNGATIMNIKGIEDYSRQDFTIENCIKRNNLELLKWLISTHRSEAKNEDLTLASLSGQFSIVKYLFPILKCTTKFTFYNTLICGHHEICDYYLENDIFNVEVGDLLPMAVVHSRLNVVEYFALRKIGCFYKAIEIGFKYLNVENSERIIQILYLLKPLENNCCNQKCKNLHKRSVEDWKKQVLEQRSSELEALSFTKLNQDLVNFLTNQQ